VGQIKPREPRRASSLREPPGRVAQEQLTAASGACNRGDQVWVLGRAGWDRQASSFHMVTTQRAAPVALWRSGALQLALV
jgi:hypothetical protein